MTNTAQAAVQEGTAEYFSQVARAMGAFNQGDFTQVLEICEETLKIWPDGPEAHLVLGVVAFSLDNQGRAIKLFERAHHLDPDCRDYAEALANVYTRVGKLNDGLYFAKLAGTLAPHPKCGTLVPAGLSNYFEALYNTSPSIHYMSAMRSFSTGDIAAAVHSCRSELDIERNNPDCWRLLGRALHRMGEYEQAVAAFHAAIHMQPGEAMDQVRLGYSLLKLGRFAEALACHEMARVQAPGDAQVHRCTAGGLAYQADQIGSRYRKWASDWSRRNVVSRKRNPRRETVITPGRKVRVGYISDRFVECPELVLFEPLLKNHSKRFFEIICYHDNGNKDVATTRFQNYADEWRDIVDTDDVTLHHIINGDDLDLLVDLSVDAEGARSGLFSQRPASAMVSWVGSPEAAGIPGMDFTLSDATTAKIDAKTCLKEQETIVLDLGLVGIDTFSLYPEINPLPARTNGHVTFGGVCDLSRISPDTARAWSAILEAVPDSRLVLGYVDQVSDDVRIAVIDLFGHFGVTDRIHVQSATDGDGDESLQPAKRFFGLIDIMLDTLPVCATVETCEALWMGVPVVSRAGARRGGLMGAVILKAAGKADWVADSEDAFVTTAAALAKDLDGLEAIRHGLREEVEKSPLFDTAAFVRSVENAYMAILRK